MSQFDQHWTLNLSVSREAFIGSFHQVIRPSDSWVRGKPYGLADDTYKDFFGIVRKHSFTIWKRPDYRYRGYLSLDGKIVEKGSSIQLELRILSYLFRKSTLIITDIVVALILSQWLSGGISAIIGQHWHLSSYFYTAYLVASVVFFARIIHRLLLKYINRYFDRLREMYERALIEIEATANKSHTAANNSF